MQVFQALEEKSFLCGSVQSRCHRRCPLARPCARAVVVLQGRSFEGPRRAPAPEGRKRPKHPNPKPTLRLLGPGRHSGIPQETELGLGPPKAQSFPKRLSFGFGALTKPREQEAKGWPWHGDRGEDGVSPRRQSFPFTPHTHVCGRYPAGRCPWLSGGARGLAEGAGWTGAWGHGQDNIL